MYTHEQIVLITQAPPSQFFLIITTEKYPWNCIFMAHVQYQEADPAPSKVKVCISSCWIKGLKRYFILGMSAFLQFSGFPKLNWNGLELNTLKKATKSLQIKRVQGLVAWHGKPKSLKLIWWKSGANKRDLLPNLEYLWRDFQGDLLQHREKKPQKVKLHPPKASQTTTKPRNLVPSPPSASPTRDYFPLLLFTVWENAFPTRKQLLIAAEPCRARIMVQ